MNSCTSFVWDYKRGCKHIESQLYEPRLINSSSSKNAWDSPLQEIPMTLKIWIYNGNLNLVSKSNSVVNCFCWMWKVWLALCGNHTVAKAPSEVGQSKIATADTKWKRTEKKIKKRDLDLDSMRQNETRGASKSPRLAMQTSSVYAVVCCHNYNAGVLGFGRHYSAICHPLLRITAIHIGHFQVFKTRDWALRGVDDLCQGCRVGNVGLPSQRVNMIVLGLELSNTSQHLWPSAKGRLLCKCNWLQIEVTLLTMYY